MPFEITREPRGVYKKFTGFVRKSEFLQSIFENHSDPDYDRMAYSINDFLDVTGHDVSAEHVKIAAIYALGAAHTNAHIKVAIVAQDPLIRDLVAGFTALTRYQLEFFTTLEDARSWVASDAR